MCRSRTPSPPRRLTRSFFPAFDETLTFEKDGALKNSRVILTDGGIYDNLGLGYLWPDRSSDVSLNVIPVDTLICCSVGYGLRQDPPSQFIFARMLSVFSAIFDRAQNASIHRLHEAQRTGQIYPSGQASNLPLLVRTVRSPWPVLAGAGLLITVAALLYTRLGQEFIPTLDEKNIAMHAIRIPSTSLSQSQQMQSAVEPEVSQFNEVAYVYSKTGTAEIATDPMPPSESDTFIILPHRAIEWVLCNRL